MTTLIGINGLMGSGKDTVGKIIQYRTSSALWNITLETFLTEYDYIQSNEICVWKIKKFAGKLKEVAGIILGVNPVKFENETYKNSTLPPQWDMYVLYNQSGNGYGCKAEIFSNKYELLNKYPDFGADPELYKRSITIRQFLQWLGTEACRNSIHPDIWVNSLFDNYYLSYENNTWYNNKGIYDVSEEDELVNPMMCPKWIVTDLRFINEYNAIKARDGICLKVIRDNNTPNEHASENQLDDMRFDWTIYNIGSIRDLDKKVIEFLQHFRLNDIY